MQELVPLRWQNIAWIHTFLWPVDYFYQNIAEGRKKQKNYFIKYS